MLHLVEQVRKYNTATVIKAIDVKADMVPAIIKHCLILTIMLANLYKINKYFSFILLS
ncbi:hypothetical protein [Chryseobacterium lathyri]|jgi:hypothetical protein|uniref:hypothetical protein n=1 Tax=Chryseobacterium TaxID=59732 RepID=UPI001CBAFB64|nr:hypothetical protein [Chryseobacterium lathyri]